MNDRYLYKAKKKKWQELPKEEWWVQGLLTKMWGQLHIIDPKDENIAYPIEEETICQSTGLKDKNGNLIWENDICRYYNAEYEMHEVFKIVWDYEEGRFLSLEVVADSEVIGSIFDNPELLEVE